MTGSHGPRLRALFSLAALFAPAVSLATSPATNLLQPVSQIPLDITPLGRVALTGSFDAVSLYQYRGQNESAVATGSQDGDDHGDSDRAHPAHHLLTPLPNGQLVPIASADAHILAMCPLMHPNGSVNSILLAGNFTSLNRVASHALALLDPNTYDVTAIEGVNGQVSTIHCDSKHDVVYLGGNFSLDHHASSHPATNAAVWSPDHGLSALPFGGFNSPVHAIAPTANGSIVFAGGFDSLANASSHRKGPQVINLSSAQLETDGTTTTDGFTDPRNILCKTSRESGPGKTWLLKDNTPGYWGAPDLGYDFMPSKLRLRNTNVDGRGTKLFAFRTLPSKGLLTLSYEDEQGNTALCNPGCPLPQHSDKDYHEFSFNYSMRMTGFTIEVWDWYGRGGGFDGIELLSDEINAYAVGHFNEPYCAINASYPATANAHGEWSEKPATPGGSSAGYLQANVDAEPSAKPPSLTFEPDIKVSANYSIYLYTPGCLATNSCNNRGQVNITFDLSQDAEDKPRSNQDDAWTILYQTNEYEKYDKIYDGYIEAASSSFRPSLTLSGFEGSSGMEIVASYVRFEMTANTTRDLNGLFVYDPANKDFSIDALVHTSIVQAATDLDPNADFNAIASAGSTLILGGNFTNSDKHDKISDIVSIDVSDDEPTAAPLPNGGLDGEVTALLALDGLIYVGGSFRHTAEGGTELLNAAIYDPKAKKWGSLNAKGFNGPVQSINEFAVNISSKVERAVAFSGTFTEITPRNDTDDAIAAPGFAIWVPSENDWLSNLDDAVPTYYGKLTASLLVNDTVLLAGSLRSGGISSPGAVELFETGDDSVPVDIGRFPVKFGALSGSSASNNSKRDTDSQSSGEKRGPLTAVYYNGNGQNLTILGGHFTAKDLDDKTIHNLVIVDGSDHDKPSGLPAEIDTNATFHSVAVHKDILYAGGKVTGSTSGQPLAGVIAFDLKNKKLSDDQPAALQGDDIIVNAVLPEDKSSNVYVGGHFQAAGGLPCPSVCMYQMDQQSWSRPGAGLDGTTNVLKWANNTLIAAGDLTVNDRKAYIARYDSKKQMWLAFNTSNTSIPGPVTSLTLGKKSGHDIYFAGVKDDGSGDPYVMHYNDSGLFPLTTLSKQTKINDMRMIGIQIDGKEKQGIILLGRIEVPYFGFASAAILKPGSDELHPFLLATDANGEPAEITGFFSEKSNTFEGSQGKHSRGIVVLVSFCIALGCVFLIVLGGIIASRIRRAQQGYVSAPQMTDRRPDLNRVPPAHLLNDINGSPPEGPGGTPMI